MNAEQLMAATQRLLPRVAEHASVAERAGCMSRSVLDALHEARLFRLFIPAELDGLEADLPDALRVFERVASADGATGWTVMIGAGAGLFAGFLEADAAREIFLPADAVIAGSGAATGRAEPVPGGYRVSGRWAYASGAHHATWFTANCVVADSAGSRDAIRSIAVPAERVRILDTWDVTGMRGTGSDDIELDDVYVPASHSFSLEEAPVATGPLYRFPFFSTAELSFAAVSLGIARHALDEFAALARAKYPMGSPQPLAGDADVQRRVALAEAALSSARAFVFERAESAWQTIARGDELDARAQALIRLASIDACHRCAAAVDLLWARAGMTPLFSDSVLGRAHRDVHTVTQNMLVSAGLYGDAGRVLLGAT